MNAMMPPPLAPGANVPVIPENAPFTASQRAWLNGFLAGLYSGAVAAQNSAVGGGAAAIVDAEDFPWHDPAIALEERQSLAAARPLPRRLMAAMAQLDCGQCGYVCQSYAEALAEGRESSASLCVPGGKQTMRAVKALLAEAPAAPAISAVPPTQTPATPHAVPVGFLDAARLTAAESAKDVRHVKLDLQGSGLSYEAGDSLGLHALNDPVLVEACLAALEASAEQRVTGFAEPLGVVLAEGRDIARPLDRTLDLLAAAATKPEEAVMLRRLAEGDDGAEPADADLLDLLQAFPSARPPLAALVASLPILKPRLYSIASSPLTVSGQVDLCVSVVQATRRGRQRDGVASCHLGHRARAEQPLRAFIQTSHFRLPQDPSFPVIMIGPGTGIAPFRAFLQHRAAIAASGDNWLFFGEQRSSSDFLFAEEIGGWRDSGLLTRLSLAWSRDQAEKIYVQDRMREEATLLWQWLQRGAYLYVCGDASRMARDVDAALCEIAQVQGGMNAEQVRDWMAALMRQGRYQRDVY